jgi:50S ribosomal subunit-associated GTPase HflX
MDGAGGYLEEEVVAERGDGGVGFLGERGVHGGDVHRRRRRKRKSRRGGDVHRRRRRKRKSRRGGAAERKRGFWPFGIVGYGNKIKNLRRILLFCIFDGEKYVNNKLLIL